MAKRFAIQEPKKKNRTRRRWRKPPFHHRKKLTPSMSRMGIKR